jgi:hypothetical protein
MHVGGNCDTGTRPNGRYHELKEHLDSHYRIVQDDEICLTYGLRGMPPEDRSGTAAS